MNKSVHSQKILHTDFLDAASAQALEAYAAKRFEGIVLSSGGYPDAERKALFFIPVDVGVPEDLSDYLWLLEISPTDKKRPLTHRDYLGSIMSAGLSRDKLGDIMVQDGRALLVAFKTAGSILLSQLDRIGGTTAAVCPLPLSEARPGRNDAKEVTVSVNSPRLDAVISALFRMARTHAAETVARGLVSVNWRETDKTDFHLSEGDVLSVRGTGRAKLIRVGGQSKKGRTFLTFEVM